MLQRVIIFVFTALASSFVVAQPIQDMSAVSITDKTVGVRLPRLRRGAIGWRTKLPMKFHPVQIWSTTISFSKLVLLHPPLTSHKYQSLFS
jgi:hypothetical protein